MGQRLLDGLGPIRKSKSNLKLKKKEQEAKKRRGAEIDDRG